MADNVQIRHRVTGEERTVSKTAAPFFPDFDVLTKDGRVNTKATAAAHTTSKES